MRLWWLNLSGSVAMILDQSAVLVIYLHQSPAYVSYEPFVQNT